MEFFNKERDNWTLVSEHPEQSVRSLLLLVLNPENIHPLFMAGGSQCQGFWLEAPIPQLRDRQFGGRECSRTCLALLLVSFLGSIPLAWPTPGN